MPPPVDARNDAHLLNGPGDSGLRQNDIDTLLFGKFETPNVAQDDVDALFGDVAKAAH